MAARFATYEEFWPFYVSPHLDPINRALRLVLLGRMDPEIERAHRLFPVAG